MNSKLSISNFTFIFIGYGHYKVTYTSPNTQNKFSAVINDMQLIDNTKNSDNPKIKDLEILKRRCKQ